MCNRSKQVPFPYTIWVKYIHSALRTIRSNTVMTETDRFWNSLRKTFPASKAQPNFGAAEHAHNTQSRPLSVDETRFGYDLNPNGPIDGTLRAHLRQKALCLYIGGRTHFPCPNLSMFYNAGEDGNAQYTSTVALDAFCLGIIGTCVPTDRLLDAATMFNTQATIALSQLLQTTSGKAIACRELDDLLTATSTLHLCKCLETFKAERQSRLHYLNLFISSTQRHDLSTINVSLFRCWAERALYAGTATRRKVSSTNVRPISGAVDVSFFQHYAFVVPALLEEATTL